MSETPKIELDLNTREGMEPRWQRPAAATASFERPKLEPVVADGDIGSDQARQTVALLMVLALVPEFLSGILGHGGISFVGVGIPAAIAWGLFTGNDWICEYAFWSCIVQVVLAPMLAFALAHPVLSVPSTLLRYGAIAVLLADHALSRKVYVLALGALGLGTLLGLIATFLR